jgi:hypothetical protein
MANEVEELAAAVDALLAVDVDGCDEVRLAEAVIAVQRERARLGVVAARLVARWERSAVWSADGSRTAAAALARDTMTSTQTAAHELRRARALGSMPAAEAAVAAGRLSLDHVDLLSRANRSWRDAVFAEHEADLVEQCAGLRFHQAVRVVNYWCQHADAVAADEQAQRDRDAAHLHASTTLDGTVVVGGLLDPVGGLIVTNELKRLERELYLADKKAGAVRTASQRRAAALVQMARRSTGATGTPARPLFTVLVGAENVERLCELANGTVVAPGALTPWLATAMVESVIFDGPSTVISVSRKRTFTGAIRRAIQVRDRHCQHASGCDVPAEDCDIDHITLYSEGGLTAQSNGRVGCPPHHRHPDKRDHPTPLLPRVVTRLDELVAHIRWRQQHGIPAGPDDDHQGAEDAA